MQKPEKLDIGLPGPTSTVTRIQGTGDTTTVLVAGFGYNLDMPVFYYLSRHFMERGMSLIRVDLGYSRDSDFMALEEEDMDRRFEADISTLAAWLESSTSGPLLLAGKSLGSTVCLRLTQNGGLARRIGKVAWLTPGTYSDEIYESLPGNGIDNLVVYGTADKYTKAEKIAGLKAVTNVEILAIEDGDHSLEKGDVSESVIILKSVLDRLTAFFD